MHTPTEHRAFCSLKHCHPRDQREGCSFNDPIRPIGEINPKARLLAWHTTSSSRFTEQSATDQQPSCSIQPRL